MKQFASLGGFNAACGAQKQAGFQFGFEPGYLLADHGFANSKQFRRFGERSCVGNSFKISQSIQVDRFHRKPPTYIVSKKQTVNPIVLYLSTWTSTLNQHHQN